MGDKRRGTLLALNLVPRERTHESSGVGSSSGPVRLTPSPCASLPLDLAEDPLVAKIVPSVYNGHAIMYTKTKVMSTQERSNMSSTALPDFDLQPGVPDGFISLKLPRTKLDIDELFTHRRVAIQKGGTLTAGGAYLWDLALPGRMRWIK